jgi:hypothetical protein
MDVEAPLVKIPVIFYLSFTLSTAAYAMPSGVACKRGGFCTQAERTDELVQSLVRAVDQCFNPSHADAMKETRQRFVSLAEKIQIAGNDWAAHNSSKIASDSAGLAKDLQSFNDSPGFPASLYCKTIRKCLEIGFEGNRKYPQCQPVGGDIHRNSQYLSFEDLMDNALPKLVALGQAGLQKKVEVAKRGEKNARGVAPSKVVANFSE